MRTQRDVLRDVMLSANECGAWLTLSELSAITRYPAASISAQLRHLKKPRFGNFALEKRMREKADIYSGNAHGVVWEYRLVRRRRVTARTAATLALLAKRTGRRKREMASVR
ncbi:MAG: hypothetical protein JST77_16385 [Acidobacteria bacterium]|nr:hypothetical protein [Acidobacteriota bacterium]